VHICGDYKVTLNKYAHVDQYPLPIVEDLFATLVGGVKFSKLDTAHAYHQVLIDDDGKQYMTINNYQGLFICNRLAFEVSSARAILQRVIENILAGIPHTVVYLDDMLVAGGIEDVHKTNAKEVLWRLAEAGLRLKKEKCNFGVEAVEYLAHLITKP